MTMRPLVLSLLAAGILAGCGQPGRTFRLVTITDLTGPYAEYGQGIRTAAAMALADRQSALQSAGWRIELSSFDASIPKAELSAAVSRIAARSDTLCVVMHTAAGNLESAQLFHAAGIPTVLPAETAALPGGDSPPEILWLSPEDRVHGENDAERITAEKYTAIFLLQDQGEHAQAIAEGFQRSAETLGLVVTAFRISPEQEDPTWIPSFKSTPPELVYFSGSPGHVPAILGHLESAGFHGALFIAESEAEDPLPAFVRSESILLYFSPAAPASEDFSQSAGFAQEYRDANAKEPPSLAALGYDAAAFCLLPLADRNAADPSRISPRAEITARWRSGAVPQGIAADYSLADGRPCRIPVFTAVKDPPAVWIPAPEPAGTADDITGC